MESPPLNPGPNLRNRSGWERVAGIYAGDEIGEDDPALREFVRD